VKSVSKRLQNISYFTLLTSEDRHVSLYVLEYFRQGMQHKWGRRGMHIGYWWESQKERDHWEDQDVDG
jgi:hypothetical protein